MKHIVFVCMIMAIITAGCGIFDDESTSSDGWKRVSLPGDLKGTWLFSSIVQFTVTGSQIDMNNREWSISRVEHKGEEHRIIMVNSHQYIVLYFKNISPAQAWNAVGVSSYTLYEATQASRTDWRVIDKKE